MSPTIVRILVYSTLVIYKGFKKHTQQQSVPHYFSAKTIYVKDGIHALKGFAINM